LSAFRQGSSWPVIVDTGEQRLVTKLRGTAQGTAPLVAEIVVGELADALGLFTPRRYLVEIEPGIASMDPHEELVELLGRSHGVNLGFQLLEGFRDLKPAMRCGFDRSWQRRSFGWMRSSRTRTARSAIRT